MVPALEALSASVAESPAMPELQTELTAMSQQIALSIPAQDLLGAFGAEWAATLRSAVAVNGADLSSAIDAIGAAGGIEVVRTRG
jgi:hypothetical protein